jgi:hypothetical protein
MVHLVGCPGSFAAALNFRDGRFSPTSVSPTIVSVGSVWRLLERILPRNFSEVHPSRFTGAGFKRNLAQKTMAEEVVLLFSPSKVRGRTDGRVDGWTGGRTD